VGNAIVPEPVFFFDDATRGEGAGRVWFMVLPYDETKRTKANMRTQFPFVGGDHAGGARHDVFVMMQSGGRGAFASV